MTDLDSQREASIEPTDHVVVAEAVIAGVAERRAPKFVSNGPVGAVVALVALRILTSWPWINGAFFGSDSKVGSYFLSGAFLKARISGPTGFAAHSLYPSVGHFVATTIYDNASFWAWIIFLGEATAGILLLLGLFTRIGGWWLPCRHWRISWRQPEEVPTQSDRTTFCWSSGSCSYSLLPGADSDLTA